MAIQEKVMEAPAENAFHVEPIMAAQNFVFMLQAKAGCHVFIINGPDAGVF